MSDSKGADSATPSQKPVPKIKDITMMKAWKDSKVSVLILLIMCKITFHAIRSVLIDSKMSIFFEPL
jgi:hypothetical protein